jgi:2-oxoglutarate dehydrogenase E1 component
MIFWKAHPFIGLSRNPMPVSQHHLSASCYVQVKSIVRVEQLYPFPKGPLKRVFEAAPDAQIVWCQEEPMNMGSWDYIDPRLEKLLVSMGTSKHTRPIYVGRNAAASPATGSLSRHLKEQQKLVNDALDLNAEGVRFVAE